MICKKVVLTLWCFLLLVASILSTIVNIFLEAMYASPKKRKQTSKGPNITATFSNRGAISENWQKLLAIMDQNPQIPVKERPKQLFTGTFRRNRLKNNKKNTSEAPAQHNLKTTQPTKEKLNSGLILCSTGHNVNNNDPQYVHSIVPNEVIDFTVEKITENPTSQRKNSNPKKLTKYIAIDCEMVGIGLNGEDHMLARVSLVNKFGDCIYDKFVKAREEVKDFRTDVSGIRKEDMLNGEEFATVQKEVAEILKGRVLIGHSLKNDLSVLFLSHPKKSIRDTSKYTPFRKITKGSTPSLKRLAKEILGIDIQHGEHSSIEDARAAMQLYLTVSNVWEKDLSQKRGYKSTS